MAVTGTNKTFLANQIIQVAHHNKRQLGKAAGGATAGPCRSPSSSPGGGSVSGNGGRERSSKSLTNKWGAEESDRECLSPSPSNDPTRATSSAKTISTASATTNLCSSVRHVAVPRGRGFHETSSSSSSNRSRLDKVFHPEYNPRLDPENFDESNFHHYMNNVIELHDQQQEEQRSSSTSKKKTKRMKRSWRQRSLSSNDQLQQDDDEEGDNGDDDRERPSKKMKTKDGKKKKSKKKRKRKRKHKSESSSSSSSSSFASSSSSDHSDYRDTDKRPRKSRQALPAACPW